MYDVIKLANYVISFCVKNGNPISNLQLQKILYYIQGYFYKHFEEFAFDEDIVAWKLGPVVPDVYYEYNHYISRPIKEEYKPCELPLILDSHRDVVDKVILKKYKKSPWDLVNDTHSELPWKETKALGGINSVIEKKLIIEYFENKDI
ncbi:MULTISPECIES: Panacea domain-containing protein [unclassified Sedimentibacter]|uniref:Panacea domain-containing protein n=1 Tax=unclassified Sedimentibacter TaxID=2649220 RepID=UPI0027E1191A|nr:type II toxin-antitoxin system antitoxin SocA domain-containing protein [Sedimentibacter sp. MB35-C1]WMJ78491.1 DUF4065 domain-containing protein [Sedimentibacter sp. MB35-C1]